MGVYDMLWSVMGQYGVDGCVWSVMISDGQYGVDGCVWSVMISMV